MQVDIREMFFVSASYDVLQEDAQHDYGRTLKQPDGVLYKVKSRPVEELLKFDHYKRLRQVSIMTIGAGFEQSISHHLLCEDGSVPPADWKSRVYNVSKTLEMYTDELTLVQKVWKCIHEHQPEPQYAAGWKISTTTFPLLISKGIEYGCRIPPQFLMDPTKNYRTACIYAVENIYTQGVYSHARYVPELNELMTWWGVQSNDGWPMLDRKTLASLSTEGWLNYGLQNVEKYLVGMADIVALYGRVACNAKPVVEGSMRGPAGPDQAVNLS